MATTLPTNESGTSFHLPSAVVIEATGNGTTDTTALFNALATINARGGRGVIILDDAASHFLFDGTIAGTLNGSGGTSKQWSVGSSSITVRGVRPGTRVKVQNSFTFGFGVDVAMTSGTTSLGITVQAGQSKIESAALAIAVQEGDWVGFTSDDIIPDITSHAKLTNPANVGDNYPGEAHRVQKIVGNVVSLEGPMVDALATNARFRVLPMTKDCGLHDLDISPDASVTSSTSILTALFCDGLRITGCRINQIGYMFVEGCVNSYITDCVINESHPTSNASNYGILAAGMVNGLHISNIQSWETRHCFTTGAGWGSGADRYGTPINIFIHNWTAYYSDKGNATSTIVGDARGAVCFDTHVEGYNIEFSNCRVVNGYDQLGGGIAFNIRCRASRVINCSLYSGRTDSLMEGIRIQTNDCFVKDFHQEGGLTGINFDSLNGDTPVLRPVVDGARFRNVRSHLVRMASCIGARVRNIDVSGGGNSGLAANIGLTSELSKAFVQVHNPRSVAMTDNKIEFCNLDRAGNNNDFSIRVLSGPDPSTLQVIGNTMHGYQGVANATTLGFDNTITGAVGFDNQYAFANYSDPPDTTSTLHDSTYASQPVYDSTLVARNDANLPVGSRFLHNDGNVLIPCVKN